MRLAPLFYPDPDTWRAAPCKRVALFGMSGLGKTHVSAMLRAQGHWFHYSVDYRIGTRYMGELISDSFKREAMKSPYLAALLRSDSISIASKIRFENLAPLSTYMGKPGDPARGGLAIDEYRRRQDEHRRAEIAALLDTPRFMERAQDIYGYPDFVADTGGSICEVVDPENPADPVLLALSASLLMVWIEGSDAHSAELNRRFARAPKPMYYQPRFLDACWQGYLARHGLAPDQVDPDDFIRATYASALSHRQPRYRAMARNWGVTVTAEEVAALRSPDDFTALIARALARA